MILDMKFQWVRLVTSTQARQHTHTHLLSYLQRLCIIETFLLVERLLEMLAHTFWIIIFIPGTWQTPLPAILYLSAIHSFNQWFHCPLSSFQLCSLFGLLWDLMHRCSPPNRDNSTRTDNNKAPVLMYTKKSGYLMKKWINSFLSLHTNCMVHAESAAQLCWISVRKAAQWNWLMLINDLWCQWSRNYLHILKIAAEVGNSASAQLWNAPPWRSCAQMSVHVGQITAAPAVCWWVAANSLNHLHVSSECFKVVVVFLFFL